MTILTKITLQVLLTISVSIIFTASTVSIAPCDSDRMLEIKEGRLSVNAVQTQMDILLSALAHQSGIRIFVQGRTDTKITMHLQHLPLEEGIKRILNGYNIALTYGTAGKTGTSITQLYVYSPTKSDNFAPIQPAAMDKTPGQIKRRAANGILIHAETPRQGDPQAGMQAIDPLMRINNADAPYLPEGFHENGDPAPDGKANSAP